MIAERKPTILDVASHARVSKSTVSNVLQDKATVDTRLRRRVLDAIDKLGYQPNAGARSMRQRSKVLGVVVGDLANPYHAELAAHVEAHAARRMHSILLVTTGGVPERESERVRTLMEHRVAAMLFLSSPGEDTLRMIGPDMPRVFVGFTAPTEVSIAVDDRAGTSLAVQHLVKLGHREIGFVSAMLADEPQTEAARYQGYREGMRRAGLRISKSHLLREQGPRSAHRSTYHDQIVALLDRPDRPTALVAALDRVALEVITAADSLGISIPGGLSLVGFDDIAIARHSRIALTTIAQPIEDLARVAVDRAIDGFAFGKKGDSPTRLTLPASLVVRRSTARPH